MELRARLAILNDEARQPRDVMRRHFRLEQRFDFTGGCARREHHCQQETAKFINHARHSIPCAPNLQCKVHAASGSSFNATRSQLATNPSMSDWHSAHPAAQAFADLDGQLQFADWNDDTSTNHISAADVPVLDASYVTNAGQVARRRVALAGQRPANVLKKLF